VPADIHERLFKCVSGCYRQVCRPASVNVFAAVFARNTVNSEVVKLCRMTGILDAVILGLN